MIRACIIFVIALIAIPIAGIAYLFAFGEGFNMISIKLRDPKHLIRAEFTFPDCISTKGLDTFRHLVASTNFPTALMEEALATQCKNDTNSHEVFIRITGYMPKQRLDETNFSDIKDAWARVLAEHPQHEISIFYAPSVITHTK